MKSKTKLALSLSCAPIVLAGLSPAATLVKINTALGSGTAPSQVFVSTGSVRPGGTAPPANAPVQGSISSPEVSSAPGGQAAEGPSSGPHTSTQSEGPRESAPSRQQHHGSSASGSSSAAPVTATGAPYSAKGGVAPEVTYNDPGAFGFSVDGGYASKHIWRGIDLAQFTSYNYLDNRIPKADSDVLFFGATATYKGFALGIKYIETIDDNFNPFYAPFTTTLDSYSELVISANYTRMLVGENWLQGTFGFDFYYYPNGEFWGVDNQGMFYANFLCPHYKWAQPFLNLFYNMAIDTDGNGLAAGSFRGEGGSALVEGMGAEIGVNGGDQIWSNDFMSVAATYSVSTIYKSGYAFEDDGFSHLSLTVGLPVTIGKNLTITPSVTYVEAIGSVTPVGIGNPLSPSYIPGAAAASLGSAWNEPGWIAAVRVNWQF
jgi:hypothetical protein